MMNNKYIYLLAFLLLLSACRKEEVILDDPSITIDPPTEIDGVFMSGQITDNTGAQVEGAVVKLYQNGELAGETITDENGLYSSMDIPLLNDSQITVAIEEEEYVAKYKRTEVTTESKQTIDLRILKKDGSLPGQDEVLENPGDPSLIKLYGTFTNADGTPLVDAYTILAWEFEKPSDDRLTFEGVTDLTDENGYVELLVPEGEEVYFLSLPNFENNQDCIDYISQEEEDILDFGLYWDNLGVITEEQELIEQDGINLNLNNYLYYGEFKNCDGSPVESGEGVLTLSYFDGDTIRRTYRTNEFGPNGEYSFDIDICGYDGDVDIKLKLTNQDTFGFNVALENTPLGGIHFAPFSACDDLRIVLLPCELNLNIGTDYSFTFDFERPPNVNPQFALATTHDEVMGFIIFEMDDIVVGENLISKLQVGWFGSDPYKFDAFGTLSADITQFSDGKIIGTIIGNVETAELGTQEVTGDFIVRYE